MESNNLDGVYFICNIMEVVDVLGWDEKMDK